jgi:hypothetical protein
MTTTPLHAVRKLTLASGSTMIRAGTRIAARNSACTMRRAGLP